LIRDKSSWGRWFRREWKWKSKNSYERRCVETRNV